MVNSKFLDFAKFHPLQFRPGQNPEWSKLSILSQILKATQNLLILPNFIFESFSVTESFEPNFQHDWKFQDFAKFYPLQVHSGNKELIRILKFDDNVKNRSKCWNLSAKCQVDQNFEIWVKRGDWSKCPNLSERGINKNIAIWRQVENQSKCWNLSANFRLDQNVEI